MAACRRVYDSRHLQADCQERGSASEPYTLGNRVCATLIVKLCLQHDFVARQLIVVVVVAAGDERADGHAAQAPAAAAPGRRQAGDRAQRETTGTGRRDR